MFNNLIESSSHAREFKRRGSFLLFTTATYVVLFVVTGVISIYAYDARLEEQTLEITLISPQDFAPEPDPAPAPSQPDRPRDASNNPNAVTERAEAMLSVNHPEHPPEAVGTTPNRNLPLPDGRTVAITGRDFDPGPAGGPPSPSGGGRAIVPSRQIIPADDQPPPPPDPPKPPKIKSLGVITGLATYLPKPAYTEIAKRARAQGSVSVQVLIDESGRVISAKALSGSPFLTVEAQKAAMQARFAPTLLSNQPVKVSGIITYNFVLGN
jgi:TonB family protein